MNSVGRKGIASFAIQIVKGLAPLYWIVFITLTAYANQALHWYWLCNLATSIIYNFGKKRWEIRNEKKRKDKAILDLEENPRLAFQDYVINPITYRVSKIQRVETQKKSVQQSNSQQQSNPQQSNPQQSNSQQQSNLQDGTKKIN